jgi:hypothetical protein
MKFVRAQRRWHRFSDPRGGGMLGREGCGPIKRKRPATSALDLVVRQLGWVRENRAGRGRKAAGTDRAGPKTQKAVRQARGEVSFNPAAPPRRGGLNIKSMDG